MRQILRAACGLWLCLGGPMQAQSTPGVVVELYTSQGCSSCPPADELLSALAEDRDVIPLSLHVDYWDYIGWEDSFADARFTDRQKAYARAVGSRTIYTPQMIVDGLERVEGNQPGAVAQLIRAREGIDPNVRLQLIRQGQNVAIHAFADPPLTEPVRVQLVRYQPESTVAIERGELAGMTVTYTNVVTQWQQVGDWNGAGALDVTVPAPGDQPVVVILQKPGPGEIVAASRLVPPRADVAPIAAEQGLAMRAPMSGILQGQQPGDARPARGAPKAAQSAGMVGAGVDGARPDGSPAP